MSCSGISTPDEFLLRKLQTKNQPLLTKALATFAFGVWHQLWRFFLVCEANFLKHGNRAEDGLVSQISLKSAKLFPRPGQTENLADKHG